ncbi:serine hydrolase domain-containing protein [Nocardiopsis oceani]
MREWRSAVAAVALLTGVIGLVGALPAQASGHAQVSEAAQTDFTPAEAVEFVDARLSELLSEQGIPGAVVSVVSDGETVHSAGYGYADPESGAEMDPEGTAVLTGSVGKSFTAAAALELVGEGRIDLHEDVNAYLPEDTRVRDAFPGQPVTLHHLLTHTAGSRSTVKVRPPRSRPTPSRWTSTLPATSPSAYTRRAASPPTPTSATA